MLESDKELIKSAINEVNQYRDLGMWGKLEEYFVDTPYVDDSAITKERPGLRHIKQLINSWRRELTTYFYATRHIVDRLKVKLTNRHEAIATTETTGKYFIAEGGRRYVLTVVCTYTYKLIKKAGAWKIGQVKVELKNQSLKPVGLTMPGSSAHSPVTA